MKRLALLAALALAMIGAPAASAVCSDPISANDATVYRSSSGVEVDWAFTVPAGCTGTTFQVKVHRDNLNATDPRDVIHAYSNASILGPGNHTLNALIVTTQEVDAILFNDGKVYGIVHVNPADY